MTLILNGRGPLKVRTLALLLMIVGAAGFIISLVAFGEQVLCLLGSTIVVFAGLGIIVFSRKYTNDQNSGDEYHGYEERRSALKEGSPGEDSVYTPPKQTPVPQDWIVSQPMLASVLNVLQGQEADYTVLSHKGGRSILVITARSGMRYVTLIDEESDTVEVSNVRVVYGLKERKGVDQGILISRGFTRPETVEWARQRSVMLVDADQIETLVLP